MRCWLIWSVGRWMGNKAVPLAPGQLSHDTHGQATHKGSLILFSSLRMEHSATI